MDRFVEALDPQALSERRSKYLEDAIAKIIAGRFPESNIVKNVEWQLDGEVFETDLVAFIDSHAIIFEAKSGRITDPALRGAPDRIKKHLYEIMISPNEQSKRFKARLLALAEDPTIDDPLRKSLPVDLSDIRKVIRVSVSLDDFGSIQANLAQLESTGWLPPDFEPCPTMTLADLETLFDFLDHPVQIVHYLERRQEIEKVLNYAGDELDLMGLYVDTLFEFGDLSELTDVFISGLSQPIDGYYNSRDAGIEIPKPEPKISELFKAIFGQLEKRETPRWTEIGVILNRFSPDDQRKLERLLAKLEKKVRKNWRVEGHDNMLILVPPTASEIALSYVLYCSGNAERRDEFIHHAGGVGLEPDHVRQCLVIAKNIDDEHVAYHFIGLFE